MANRSWRGFCPKCNHDLVMLYGGSVVCGCGFRGYPVDSPRYYVVEYESYKWPTYSQGSHGFLSARRALAVQQELEYGRGWVAWVRPQHPYAQDFRAWLRMVTPEQAPAWRPNK